MTTRRTHSRTASRPKRRISPTVVTTFTTAHHGYYWGIGVVTCAVIMGIFLVGGARRYLQAQGAQPVSGEGIKASILQLPFFSSRIRIQSPPPPRFAVVPFDIADPPPPTDFTVMDPGTGRRLELAWRVPSGVPLQSVRIYRAGADGTYARIGEVAAGGATWIDRGLSDGVMYRYTLRSVVENHEGGRGPTASGVSSDRTPPAPPSNVKIQVGDLPTVVTLTWHNPMDEDFVGVRIYRSQDSAVLGARIADQIATARYRDESAPAEQRVMYVLTSVDAAGNESLPTKPAPAVGRVDPFRLP